MDVNKMVAPVARMVADKRRYQQYKARVAALPTPWPDVAAALERYHLLHFGPMTAAR